MSTWAEGEKRDKHEPLEKPVPAILAAVTLDVQDGDVREETTRRGMRQEFDRRRNIPDLPPILVETLPKDFNEGKTIGQFDAEAASIHEITLIKIPYDPEQIRTAEDLGKLQSAAHDFLVSKGIQLKPPMDTNEEFSENKSFLKNCPDVEPYVEFHLEPDQKMSSLGQNGRGLLRALTDLADAAFKANERGAQLGE